MVLNGNASDGMKFLRRTSAGSIPISSASRSMMRSISNAASGRPAPRYARSEEHTSELQSHHDLVCRLLLEKKKEHEDRQRQPAGASDYDVEERDDAGAHHRPRQERA